MAKLLALSLSFCLLVLGASSFSFRQQPEENACQFQRLNSQRPDNRIESEGGFIETWNPNRQEFQCAGVALSRCTLRRNALRRPFYSNAPQEIFIQQAPTKTLTPFHGSTLPIFLSSGPGITWKLAECSEFNAFNFTSYFFSPSSASSTLNPSPPSDEPSDTEPCHAAEYPLVILALLLGSRRKQQRRRRHRNRAAHVEKLHQHRSHYGPQRHSRILNTLHKHAPIAWNNLSNCTTDGGGDELTYEEPAQEGRQQFPFQRPSRRHFQGQDQSQEQQDSHQKVHRFKEGDLIAVPTGVAFWMYNDEDTDVVALSIIDTNNNNNQLDQFPRRFYLAGNQEQEFLRYQQQQGRPHHQQISPRFRRGDRQEREEEDENEGGNIFSGFTPDFLAQAFQVDRQTVQNLRGENEREEQGAIVTVKGGLQVLTPDRDEDEEDQFDRRRQPSKQFDEDRYDDDRRRPQRPSPKDPRRQNGIEETI
ncbi:hypothetical protein PIB30_099310, partial [Stylosanthes scabra]|nr:hypothetical protein [Stylosanthes scabra]